MAKNMKAEIIGFGKMCNVLINPFKKSVVGDVRRDERKKRKNR